MLTIFKGLEYIFSAVIYIFSLVLLGILWLGFVIVEMMKGIGKLTWKTIMR